VSLTGLHHSARLGASNRLQSVQTRLRTGTGFLEQGLLGGTFSWALFFW
jgi:hypothetical protein